ncbi:DNA-binding transcriptional activator of the SARP family [Slackia heliotrinireducens]|uniref:DNA-binding transcriptional activator of the SARP family n=1 Tax=Slackia heliotrinireducens (strain ATCC 29202 / DSM 20476 / NCTC 11029 / RHS 1) TaxID=471855 RepID=C7N1Z6_SLAHD|nr:BTAD domain-containing putative transcriptional regulator [Slackia heliotrinireducens]ACV23437.1 DNA-binding transcriptional activator of the SARP family [Slackia heliotrinireducens DSM 20476]VEH02742.1 DNA-binding transcriptional activator of the SARP family [Slackia heliotrinireducens]
MVDVADENTFRASFFGPFSLTKGDVTLSQSTARSKQLMRLLSALIYNNSMPGRNEHLMDILWPGSTDDPAHALANLVYRLRKLLDRFWPGEDLIVSGKGIYYWSPDVPLVTDFQTMQDAVARSRDAAEETERRESLMQAVSCYRGRFLEEFPDEYDLLPRQSYYHNLFLGAVKNLADIYDRNGEFEDEESLARAALALDPSDEDLHCAVLRAYAGMNRILDAERYYLEATGVIMQYTGGVPSMPMTQLYEAMLSRISQPENDLDRIAFELDHCEEVQRAMLCEYGVFRNIYALNRRLKDRNEAPSSIVLVTLDTKAADLARSGEAVDRLEQAILSSLRRGDAVTRFSGSQYLILLAGCSVENVDIVMKRVLQAYYTQGAVPYRVTYSARSVE